MAAVKATLGICWCWRRVQLLSDYIVSVVLHERRRRGVMLLIGVPVSRGVPVSLGVPLLVLQLIASGGLSHGIALVIAWLL